MSLKPVRRLLGALTATVLALPLAAGVVAAPAHAETLGQAIVAKADSYIGGNYTIGPWQENWCGDFVRYIWTSEGVSAASWMTAYVPDWTAAPGYHPISSGYTPQPGDAVVYADNTYANGSHIAIVTNYANGLLSDVGGDEGGTPNGPFWATSHVGVDEDGGQAFDPTKHLFVGTSYEMWVIGYVSLPGGTPPPPPSVSAPSGIANGLSYHGTVTVTGTSSQSATAFYLHLRPSAGGADIVPHPAIPGGTSFSYQFDTTGATDNPALTIPDGTYEAFIGAEINGSEVDGPPITIAIKNITIPAPPAVSVPGGAQSVQVTLTASAPGATSVVYFVDGKQIGSSNAGGSFPLQFDSTALTAGPHAVTATASNSSGTSSPAPAVTLSTIRSTAAVYDPSTSSAEVFSIGTDGSLGFTSQSSSGWTQWSAIGSGFVGTPSAVYEPNTKTVEVFARGKDGYIYHAYNTNNTGWYFPTVVSTFWKLAGDPAAVYDPGSQTTKVFAVGTDGSLGHSDQTSSGWSDWAEVGSAHWVFTGTPSAVYEPNTNTVDVFARGTDGTISHAYDTNNTGWAGYFNVNTSNTLYSNPTAVYEGAGASGNPEVFGIANNHYVDHTYLTSSGWSQWFITDPFWTF